MRYDITGEHRSAYDRRACRTDETPAANLDAARAVPCAGQGSRRRGASRRRVLLRCASRGSRHDRAFLVAATALTGNAATMTTTEVPSPRLVAAQMRLGILATESVPLWAAHWLAQGFDGEAVVELAGLSGRDTRTVADVLPAALEEAGIPPMTSLQAEVKVAFDHIAAMHIQGRASWRWVMETVRETISQGGYEFEFFDEPLAAVYGLDDELGAAWGRAEPELARDVLRACEQQLNPA